MRQQIAFHQYNPNKPHRHGLLLKSLNDARFPNTNKAVPYAAKPKAGDGPYYLKSTIDYIKYLVTKMEADQPITGRTISIFSATCHIEKEKKNIWLILYTFKTKSKGKKNVVVLLTPRPLHGKTTDDGNEKPQIINFYDFKKGGTDMVD